MIVFPYVKNVEFADGDIYVRNRKIRLGFYFPAEKGGEKMKKSKSYEERIQNQFQGFLRQHYWRDED